MLKSKIGFTRILLMVFFTWLWSAQNVSGSQESGALKRIQNDNGTLKILQQHSKPDQRQTQILPPPNAAKSRKNQNATATGTKKLKSDGHNESNWTDYIVAISTVVIAFFTVLLGINAFYQFSLQKRLANLERPNVLLVPLQCIAHDKPNLFEIKFWYDCINVGRAPAILGDIRWEFSYRGKLPNGDFTMGQTQTDSPTRILGTDSRNNTHSRNYEGAILALQFDRDRFLPNFRDGSIEFILRTSIQYDDASTRTCFSYQAFRLNFHTGAWERWGGHKENFYT